MTHNSGNALIVSTQRLGQIAGLSCLDVAEAVHMLQCFVCREAKYTHRWKPTGHQMTCCGVVAGSALGLRERIEREKRREQGHCDPYALLKLCPAVLVGCHNALKWSALKHQDSEKKKQKHACVLLCTAVLDNNSLYHHRLTKQNENLYVSLCRCAPLTFLKIPWLIMTAL